MNLSNPDSALGQHPCVCQCPKQAHEHCLHVEAPIQVTVFRVKLREAICPKVCWF
jgi:hypothetical protein